MADRTNNSAAVAAIFAVSLVVLGKQLVVPGVHCCLREDAILYVNWSRQAADMFAQGVLYPRWMPDAHGGYGTPTLVFYAPVVIYLTALFKLATSDIGLSVALVKLVGVFLSGAFMYLFIKELWGGIAGLFAAIMYMALPFRIFDLYFLGVFPSKFAFVWFPLILYFTGRAVSEPRAGKATAGLAVSYALLCLTHILSGYMFAPVIVSYALVSAARGNALIAAGRVAVAAGLGMALAGFYLLPVVAEHNLVHLDTMPVKLWGQYWHNYPFFVIGPRSPYNQPFNIYLGRTIIASVLLGITAYLLSRMRGGLKETAETPFFAAVVIISLFLMTDMSGFLWKVVPGLKMVLFPTRWAVVTVFGLACLAGAGLGTGASDGGTAQGRRSWIWAVPFALALSWSVHLDAEIVVNGCVMTSQEVADFPKDLEVEEYVPKTVSLEWLRNEADNTSSPEVSSLDSDSSINYNIERWGGQDRLFRVTAERPSAVRVRTFYYPGWRAYIDGKESGIGVQDRSGAMILELPAGTHEVALRFGATTLRLAGWGLSAAAAFMVVVLLRRRRGESATNTGMGIR